MKILAYLILSIICGIFWRMGGSAAYNKLWRRTGSTLCVIASLLVGGLWIFSWKFLVAAIMIGVGCSSYFGWLTPGDPDEKWFNFLAAALMTQGSILLLSFSLPGLLIALAFSLAGALGKVWLDECGKFKRPDIIGEIAYGFLMCAGISINSFLISLPNPQL